MLRDGWVLGIAKLLAIVRAVPSRTPVAYSHHNNETFDFNNGRGLFQRQILGGVLRPGKNWRLAGCLFRQNCRGISR